MGSEAEQDVLYCCFVTISLLGYRTLLKNDGRESLPFIQGPNLFKIYVYCSIHIVRDERAFLVLRSCVPAFLAF